MKYIMVTLVVKREGDYYVSECPELGTASFGRTEHEAFKNVSDATELYLNTLEELSECERVLKDKGVQIRSDEAAARKVACPPGSTVYSQILPIQAGRA